MAAVEETSRKLPSDQEIRLAVELYLQKAYEGATPPAATQNLIPPESFVPEEWLMSDNIERDPPNAPWAAVRSFVLRLGNLLYPHMKMRISRPPNHSVYLFSVDSHDAFLSAPAGSPDFEPLEALKRANSSVAATILQAWEAAGLMTERAFMRLKISQATKKQ